MTTQMQSEKTPAELSPAAVRIARRLDALPAGYHKFGVIKNEDGSMFVIELSQTQKATAPFRQQTSVAELAADEVG